MNRLSLVVVVLAAMAAVAGCQKADEAKPEVKAAAPAAPSAPKAAETPAVKPADKSASQVEKETLAACVKRNPDNGDYCKCYSSELGQRYAEKAKSGDVSVQERGQMAVQSALACKKFNKK